MCCVRKVEVTFICCGREVEGTFMCCGREVGYPNVLWY